MTIPKIKYIYPTTTFWISVVALVFVFILGYLDDTFFVIGKILFWILMGLIAVEIIALWIRKDPILAERIHEERLSNGDRNDINLAITNNYPFDARTQIIDEVPYQFQVRDFSMSQKLGKHSKLNLTYHVYPTERGTYQFGNINVYVKYIFGLIERKIVFNVANVTKVYPSYIQLRKHILLAATDRLDELGSKRVRKIGRSLEFDQISKYYPGEDYRTINWKASARRGELMINRYIEEKSQPIYNVIDMGRGMRMPFENMTLADYAINSALVLSAMSIKKGDKSGLLTFSDTIGKTIEASNRKGQMTRILDLLYNADTDYRETGYHVVYKELNKLIKDRSLVMLYTNFESMDVLNRDLPYLKAIAGRHLLVTVVFKNTEIENAISSESVNPRQASIKTIAEELEMEKREVIATLNRHGIQTIYTTPQNLTTDTINRYLRIKAQNLI